MFATPATGAAAAAAAASTRRIDNQSMVYYCSSCMLGCTDLKVGKGGNVAVHPEHPTRQIVVAWGGQGGNNFHGDALITPQIQAVQANLKRFEIRVDDSDLPTWGRWIGVLLKRTSPLFPPTALLVDKVDYLMAVERVVFSRMQQRPMTRRGEHRPKQRRERSDDLNDELSNRNAFAVGHDGMAPAWVRGMEHDKVFGEVQKMEADLRTEKALRAGQVPVGGNAVGNVPLYKRVLGRGRAKLAPLSPA